MERCIITPTYIEHFKFIPTYLNSFNKYVLDKENVTICFIVSINEKEIFWKIIEKYVNKISIVVLYLEEELSKHGIHSNSVDLINKFGRFTFQTIKKYLAMSSLHANQYLVIDSESVWINYTNIITLYNEYFSNPRIYFSQIELRQSTHPAINSIIDNISILFNEKISNWYIENFMWFYDRRIVDDMFDEIGDIFSLVEKVFCHESKKEVKTGLFEIVLYNHFIYKNYRKYGYDLINIDLLFDKYFSNKLKEEYFQEFYRLFNGGCGILEHALVLVNNNNYNALIDIIKAGKIEIIRCSYSTPKLYRYQKKIIDAVSPKILAADQNHYFSSNYKAVIVKYVKYFAKSLIHSRLLKYLKKLNKKFSNRQSWEI